MHQILEQQSQTYMEGTEGGVLVTFQLLRNGEMLDGIHVKMPQDEPALPLRRDEKLKLWGMLVEKIKETPHLTTEDKRNFISAANGNFPDLVVKGQEPFEQE